MNKMDCLMVMFSAVVLSFVAPARAVLPSVASAPAAVTGIKVQPDKAPDCSSLKSIVESVTRGCKSNDEKAVAIYNFMNLTHYHLAYPNEPGGIPALKEINCYGWSLCGGLHTVESALWRELGWGWRYVGWSNPGHTTVEAQYDGSWHYIDIFLKFYAWMPDGKGGRTIAGQEDLQKQSKALLTEGMIMDKDRNCVYAANNSFVTGPSGVNWQAPALLSCGDPVKGVVSGVNSRSIAGSPDRWNGINHATGNYSTEVALAPGYTLENTWDALTNAWFWQGKKEPRHTCTGHKDTRNDPAYGLVLEPYINSKPTRGYANGTLSFAPDFSSGNVLKSFVATDNVRQSGKALVPEKSGVPGSVTFSLSSPYILTQAGGDAAGADTVEVSSDAGATFVPADLKDFSDAVRGRMAVLVRVSFKTSLTALKVKAIIQNNPGALPYLSPGQNEVAVSVADPKALGNNELVVTYAYRLGSRAKSFAKLCESGREIARQHGAKWSDVMTVAQKRFSAKDLPATFVIDCPTPKGQYPVYPRMVFVRREVVAPGGSPEALPEGAEAAKAASADELQTLPNPFLIGTQPPPAWGGASSASADPGSGEKAMTKAAPAVQSDSSSPIGGGAPAVSIPARKAADLVIPLTYVNFINDKGEVSASGKLRWPKPVDAPGKVVAGIVQVKGDLKGLSGKAIASARLVVPVNESHDKADTRIGAILLQAPIDPAKALKGLPEVAGTCVLPEQTEPPYKPGKPFAIDVTATLKAAVAEGTPFYGFAVRVVPDREVDSGYTVNCKISPSDPITLEVDLAGK